MRAPAPTTRHLWARIPRDRCRCFTDMVREATRRAATIANGPPTVFCSAIQDSDGSASRRFDAVLSNFGPLNCVPTFRMSPRRSANALVPGGVCVASVIGRVPVGNRVVSLADGPRRATIRFRPDAVGVPLKDGTVWMRYLTPSEFARPFRAGRVRAAVEAGARGRRTTAVSHALADRKAALAASTSIGTPRSWAAAAREMGRSQPCGPFVVDKPCLVASSGRRKMVARSGRRDRLLQPLSTSPASSPCRCRSWRLPPSRGHHAWALVDGNLEPDPCTVIPRASMLRQATGRRWSP